MAPLSGWTAGRSTGSTDRHWLALSGAYASHMQHHWRRQPGAKATMHRIGGKRRLNRVRCARVSQLVRH